jgi:GAF domain-containing protein
MDEQKLRFYQSLYQIASVINSSRTYDGVLSALVESVAMAQAAKGCSLMLLTPNRSALLHTSAFGLSERYVRKGPILADESISEALRGKAVAVLNAPEDERVQYQQEAKEEGIASTLSGPMMLREEIIGVIRVYTSELRHFTMDDICFTEAVANLGAIALENAQLYEAVQKDRDELRREMLEWRAGGWGKMNG